MPSLPAAPPLSSLFGKFLTCGQTCVAPVGSSDADSQKIEPTVMGQEIFGPVFPILSFREIDEVIDTINAHDKPLALYIYAGDKAVIRKVTFRCAFGGTGESGMGSYHGKVGFETFRHHKSIVDKKTWMDLPMRYQPYNKLGDKLIHRFLR